ncbi:hypothetical protein GGQ73_003405 [Rhizobium skierniewicense]|uniref:Uncharacterized protein n=1 Tax=Rhizobium skierniewicense TaxID=984260 RepID=A0A7W6C811_9HYPH|nr:hypothetical protein [Rhizobium skierniewicense]
MFYFSANRFIFSYSYPLDWVPYSFTIINPSPNLRNSHTLPGVLGARHKNLANLEYSLNLSKIDLFSELLEICSLKG